jgi:excisionase family DNA binding protein
MPGTAKRMTTASSGPTDAAASFSALLTAEQMMGRLGVSRTSLWSLMRKNGLPYIKLGSGRRASLRFSAESVDRWLKQNEQRDAYS